MVDLNTLIDPAAGWELNSAQAINDHGQITGYGFVLALGQQHAFLLTPIPEPSTLALLGAGIALAWIVGQRRVRRASR
jgi:hypothetical protein